MRTFKALQSLFAITCYFTAAFGADYIVPTEYDNMQQSVKSNGYITISNSTPGTSTISKQILNSPSSTLKYKCVSIPKITCRNATTYINAQVSEIRLFSSGTYSGQPMMITGSDMYVEDATTQWKVCGAATGAIPTGNLSQSGGTITYTALSSENLEWFFIYPQNNTDTNSYMTIFHTQSCR